MTPSPDAQCKILVVLISQAELAPIAERLRADGLAADCRLAQDRATLEQALTEGGWSVLLAGDRVPGLDLEETLGLAARAAPGLPTIAVAGRIGEERVAALLRAGAADFVAEDRPAGLVPAIRRCLAAAAVRAAPGAGPQDGPPDREAELRALRETALRYQALVETSFDWIWEVDGAGRYTFVSPKCLDLLGYTPQEMIGRRPFDFMSPEDAQRIGRIFSDLAAQGASFSRLENVNLAKDGRRVVLETSGVPIRGPGGELLGYRGTDRDITASHAAESRLRLQGIALESAANGVVITDAEGTIEWVNGAFAAITGYAPNEAVGRKPGDLLRSRLQDPGFYADLWQTILNGRPWHGELINRRKTGDFYFESMSITPVTDPDGVIRHFVAIKQDISARKRAEQALREREMQYRGVIETSMDGFWILDTRGSILEVNDAYARRCGYSRPELLRMRVSDLLDRPDPLGTAQRIARVMSLGQDRFDSVHRTKDGEAWPVEVTVSYWPIGGGRLFAFLRDVAEERQAQAELEQYRHRLEELVETRTAELKAAEEQTRLILESTADGLYGVDEQGRCTFVNPAACAVLGYRPDQILGRNTHELIHGRHPDGRPYERAQCPLATTLAEGRVVRGEDEVFWRADGQPVPVVYATHPMYRDGRIVGAVMNFSDTTARREAERERDRALAEAERLARVKSEFLANMSHEIRTPLNAVLGLAQLGQQEGPGPRTPERFGRILDSGQLLLGIVDDILDFSKLEAGRLALEEIPFSLGETLDRAVDLTAPRALAKGIAFRVDEAPDLPERCIGDALRISQILVNLLSNAIKFTDRGGVSLGVFREGDILCLRVSDTGLGIGPEQIGGLFVPFQQADGSTTRRFGGTGLGLTISRRLARMMGGNIEVASRLGEGSVFLARVPLRGAVPPADASGLRAILTGVDDWESLRLVAGLRGRGMRVDRLAPAEAFATGADILVAGVGLLGDQQMESAVRAAVDRGQVLAAIVPPGGNPTLPGIVGDGLRILERPLRVRHVIAAARRERLAHHVPVLAHGAGGSARARLHGLRLLAAEDNEINRLVLEDLLRGEGAILVGVENGREAVERVERDGPGAWDLVLMDVQMPEMDGYAATARIRALDPGLPIIGLTAHAMAEERARCLAAGMAGHLAKPYRLDDLVDAILERARRGPDPGAAFDQTRLPTVQPPARGPSLRPAAPIQSGQLGPDPGAGPAPHPGPAADAADWLWPRYAPASQPGSGPDPMAPSGVPARRAPLLAPPPETLAAIREPGRPGAAASGLVDWATLENRFPSGAAFVDRLAGRVIEGHAGAPARLRELATLADHRELALLAHGLKGMLGNLMAEDLRLLAAALEGAARSGEPAALGLAQALAEGMERLLAELAERLAGAAGDGRDTGT